jgi:hypothetical protein
VPLSMRHRSGNGEPNALSSPLKSLPAWIWVVEAIGIALIVAAGLISGYPQTIGAALGVALLLALPLGVLQHVLEERLEVKIEQVVSDSIAAVASKRLSGPSVPLVPEDLELWPFTALAEPASGARIRLRLRSASSVISSVQPIEVMIVVTDPISRTFCTDRKGQDIVSTSVIDWVWPDDFTSGDIRDGEHTIEFFVAPLSAGPARRFGLAATSEFVYRASGPVFSG